jgi:hypothetical protein
VAEHLPSKGEALSSNPTTAKQVLFRGGYHWEGEGNGAGEGG